MSRTQFLRRLAPALTLTAVLVACGTGADDQVVTPPDDTTEESAEDPAEDDTGDDGADSTDEGAGADVAATFPVTIAHDGGEVTLDEAPDAIVSLSPTATEMLFAIGAGDQVVAADEFSNFPDEAPTTDLSGFEPNVEAVLEYAPDLVVAQNDANDLVAQLEAAGVPVVLQGSAVTLDDTYRQITALGVATGNAAAADELNTEIAEELAALVDEASGEGLTYYHELDSTLFSVTSSTFIGEVYGLFGLENVADAADPDGAAFGYPQLSAEYLVEADPDLVFLACTVFCGETAETFAARDGFGSLTAVEEGRIIELDDDVASRWGPRVVDFAGSIADALATVDAG